MSIVDGVVPPFIVTVLAMGAWGSAFAQAPLVRLIGPHVQSLFGHDARFLGDANQDGVPDFVVGAYRHNVDPYNQPGTATVYSGVDFSVIYEVTGHGLDWLGISVAPAGDVDGDGRDDLLVGATEQQQGANLGGYARIVSSASGATLFEFGGTALGQETGSSVDGAGDVDLDGFPDVLVGSRFEKIGANKNAGAVRLYSGKTGALIRGYLGDEPDQWAGWSCGNARDVNLDGVPDQLVGLPGANTATFAKGGRVRLYSGASGALMKQFDAASSNDVFGYSVAGPGDLNGDGIPDVLIGVPNDDTIGFFSGSVRAYSGATFASLYVKRGDGDFDGFGDDVQGIGDIDQDGKADFIVGAPDNDQIDAESGMARTFSGATGSVIRTYLGAAKNDLVGSAVAGGFDLNGDGRPDLLIGGEQTIGLKGFVDVWSSDCGSIANEGTGCAGSGGFVPSLVLTGCVAPKGPLSVVVAGAFGAPSGANSAVLLLGASTGSTPLGNGGCTLLLSNLIGFGIPIPLLGVGAGQGSISFTATIPDGVVGPWTLHVQALCADPGISLGYTASNALKLEAH